MIVLNAKTRELIITKEVNKKFSIDYRYELTKNEFKFLLLSIDNDLHTYSEYVRFIPTNSIANIKVLVGAISKKFKLHIKNYSRKGYKVLDEVYLDY